MLKILCCKPDPDKDVWKGIRVSSPACPTRPYIVLTEDSLEPYKTEEEWIGAFKLINPSVDAMELALVPVTDLAELTIRSQQNAS